MVIRSIFLRPLLHHARAYGPDYGLVAEDFLQLLDWTDVPYCDIGISIILMQANSLEGFVSFYPLSFSSENNFQRKCCNVLWTAVQILDI